MQKVVDPPINPSCATSTVPKEEVELLVVVVVLEQTPEFEAAPVAEVEEVGLLVLRVQFVW